MRSAGRCSGERLQARQRRGFGVDEGKRGADVCRDGQRAAGFEADVNPQRLGAGDDLVVRFAQEEGVARRAALVHGADPGAGEQGVAELRRA